MAAPPRPSLKFFFFVSLTSSPEDLHLFCDSPQLGWNGSAATSAELRSSFPSSGLLHSVPTLAASCLRLPPTFDTTQLA